MKIAASLSPLVPRCLFGAVSRELASVDFAQQLNSPIVSRRPAC